MRSVARVITLTDELYHETKARLSSATSSDEHFLVSVDHPPPDRRKLVKRFKKKKNNNIYICTTIQI